jgi:hypothetical protein
VQVVEQPHVETPLKVGLFLGIGRYGLLRGHACKQLLYLVVDYHLPTRKTCRPAPLSLELPQGY